MSRNVYSLISFAIAAIMVLPSMASATIIDFEGAGPFDTSAWGSGTSAQVVADEEYHSANHALKLTVNSGGTNNDGARIAFDVDSTLADLVAYEPSYWAKVTGITAQELAPYMGFVVDTNGDDSADSWLLELTPTTPLPDTPAWYQATVTGGSSIHVAGDSTGVADYTIGQGGGLLGDLVSEEYSSGTLWGDLQVLQVRIYAGIWNGTSGDFVGYIDDVDVPGAAAIPEPASFAVWALLACVGIGVTGRRRR